MKGETRRMDSIRIYAKKIEVDCRQIRSGQIRNKLCQIM